MRRAPRQEFPQAVRKAAFIRCGGPSDPKCEGCGRSLRNSPFQYDHDTPDGLGGKPTLDNCRVLCSGSAASCHAVKTAADVARMTKADNQAKAHTGTGRAKARIPSPPRSKREPRRIDLEPLPRRSLYR